MAGTVRRGLHPVQREFPYIPIPFSTPGDTIVPILRPFRGYRPLAKHAASVASKPYDVVTTEEARREVADNPLSFLRVGRAEADLPPGTQPYSAEVYQKARENYNRLLDTGIIQCDPEPLLYAYALSTDSHVQYGVVGCISVEQYQSGLIKKHELTRPDKEDDRTRHILATNAQTGPVLLAYRSSEEINALVAAACSREPQVDFVARDGVRHRLWTIKDGEVQSMLERQFAELDAFYIADGHHRVAAGARAAIERIRANPRHTGQEEYNFLLAVVFPHTQLQILDYNRVVRDLNGYSAERFVNALSTSFEITPSDGEVRPTRKGEFGVYVGGRWYRLRARVNILRQRATLDQLDVNVLQTNVLSSLLGIQNQQTDPRIDFVGGGRGLTELTRRVNSGEMAIAFSLFPTAMEDLLTVADAGHIMPPKSTWFEPKLRDGLVIHGLDE